MSIDLATRSRAEIIREDFRSLELGEMRRIARVLDLNPETATREALIALTLGLTRDINRHAQVGDENNLEAARALALKKGEIAEILYSRATRETFGKKIGEDKFSFTLEGPNRDQTQRVFLQKRLGDDSSKLLARLAAIAHAHEIDPHKSVPKLNSGVISLRSNEKYWGDQVQHYSHGLAQMEEVVNLATEAVCRARTHGINLSRPWISIGEDRFNPHPERIYREALDAGLGEGTATMLKMLSIGGLRSADPNVVITLTKDGALSAYASNDKSPTIWAVGAAKPDQ